MRIQNFIVLAIALAFTTLPPIIANAQDEEKAVMLVRNYRNETITMDFSYVISDYSWQFMERDIGLDGDLTYKFPTGLPGCDYLMDWGIDNARLTISNSKGVICTKDISICECKTVTIEVRSKVCYMKNE